MFKFKGKNEIIKDIHILLDEISDDLDDIKNDLDDLHESVQESLRLTLDIQDQCQQIIKMMEKNNARKEERTLEEIVDNIEKLVGKDNAREEDI